MGSPEHIVQLFDKVINNGVEFSQDKIISIKLSQQNQHAKLYVSNNGILLPEQLSDNLFDSMVSLRSAKTRKDHKPEHPHLGLGLYIARLICQFHHGKINAYNHLKGVTVQIDLPVHKP